MEVRRIQNSSPSELYHHGIKGQEWGKMHGPPYPLDKQTSAAVKKEGAIKKKKNIFERHRDKKKMKKLRQIRDQKQAEKKERDRIINTGDANEISKIKDTLSDEEYARALSRISLNQSLSEYKTATNRAKLEDIANKVSTVSKVVGNVANAADAGIKVYQGLQNAGIIEKKQSNMDQLKAEKTRLELLSDIADLTNKITDSKSKNQKEITKLKNQTEFEKANYDLEDIKKKRDDLKNGPDKMKQLEKDSKEWEYMAKIAKNKNTYDKFASSSNSSDSGSNGKKDKSGKKGSSAFDSNVDVDKAKRKKLDSKQDVNIAKTFVDAGLVPDVKKGLKGNKRAAVQASLVRQVYQDDHPGTFNQAEFKSWLKSKGYDQNDIDYLTGGYAKHRDPNMSTVRRLRDDELYHHGIKGQRWGVRRYQNADGSLTDAGQQRYNKIRSRELGKLEKRKEDILPQDTLEHRGIKGQRRGVRRYQYANGTYTALGNERYRPGKRRLTKENAEKALYTSAAIGAVAALGKMALPAAASNSVGLGSVITAAALANPAISGLIISAAAITGGMVITDAVINDLKKEK